MFATWGNVGISRSYDDGGENQTLNRTYHMVLSEIQEQAKPVCCDDTWKRWLPRDSADSEGSPAPRREHWGKRAVS